MKATLEFNLPEDMIDHQDALNGCKYRAILGDLLRFARRCDKSDEPFNTDTWREALRDAMDAAEIAEIDA